MSYRGEVWGVACRLSRQLSPYITTHVRGGDGPFKKENHIAAMSGQLRKIKKTINEYVSKGGLNVPRDCAGNTSQADGWAVRLLVVSDLSPDNFRKHIGSKVAFNAVVDEMAQVVGAKGFGMASQPH
jgi:hypothetical protein